MTRNEDDKVPFDTEGGSELAPSPVPPHVSTHVGRNNVAIDVPALRHLVDTVKAKLKP